MKKSERIAKLFGDLYDGDPWIDVTIKDTLRVYFCRASYEKNFGR